jgi:hypothetical protein
MIIEGWQYYNHAAIPTTPPHISPNLEPVENGEIWKLDGAPYMVRYTTDFDCEQAIDWWYIIKRAPYDIESLPPKKRKHIRQAVKKCEVRIIDQKDYLEELWDVYDAAFARYVNAKNTETKEHFIKKLTSSKDRVFWGAFDRATGQLVGYMSCGEYEDYVNIYVSKYHPQYLNLRASDALNDAVLAYYLNQKQKTYICRGERSILHITNAQEYAIENFGFQKAYCQLHIKYSKRIAWIVKLLYPFRKIINKVHISIAEKVSAVLLMEEIARKK